VPHDNGDRVLVLVLVRVSQQRSHVG
jgi:hypothetical protein